MRDKEVTTEEEMSKITSLFELLIKIDQKDKKKGGTKNECDR